MYQASFQLHVLVPWFEYFEKIRVLTRGYFLFVYLYSPSPHLRELLLYSCYTSFTLGSCDNV